VVVLVLDHGVNNGHPLQGADHGAGCVRLPSLPHHLLTRPDRLQSLKDAVLADLQRPVVVTGMALWGALHDDTLAAVRLFVSSGLLDRFLKSLWRHSRSIGDRIPAWIAAVDPGIP
jgi:hypothetical protein